MPEYKPCEQRAEGNNRKNNRQTPETLIASWKRSHAVIVTLFQKRQVVITARAAAQMLAKEVRMTDTHHMSITVETITTVVASAAMGALVSSVSTLVGQTLERSSRRKELLIAKAVTIAKMHINQMVDYHKTTGEPVDLAPTVVLVRSFHRELKSLYYKEALSPEMEEQFKDYIYLGKGRSVLRSPAGR